MYQRLVHYINLSLCKETYSPLEAVDKFKIIKSEIKKPEKKKITVWEFQNKKRSTTVRQNARNAIKTKPGLSKSSGNIHSEMDAFSTSFTDEMFDNTVQHTNKRKTNILEIFGDLLKQSDKYHQMKEVTIDEMKAFIGLLYFFGLYGVNNHTTNILFSQKHGMPVLGNLPVTQSVSSPY